MKTAVLTTLLLSSLAISPFLGASASQTTCHYDCLVVPLLEDSLVSLGSPTRISEQDTLPARQLRVLVWNIRKGIEKRFSPEFDQFSRNADLILLQEAIVNHRNEAPFIRPATQGFDWKMGVGWISKTYLRTGVATGARARIQNPQIQRTSDREPLAATPKMNLLTRHRLQGSDKILLVANIHAINFRNDGALSRQLKQIGREVQAHQGPVLLAGDFNTWNESRMGAMFDYLKSLGLTYVKPVVDERFIKFFDHAWTRGLRVEHSHVADADASDHPAYQLLISAE